MFVCRILCIVFFSYSFVSCNSFEYSPNQAFDRNTPRDLNAANLEKLLARAIDDTVIIAFVGDSQRFMDELDRFVSHVNKNPNIDFVVLAGDISDFGLLAEYEWVYERLSRINAPYFGVIGNHDVIANGESVFTRMFGPPDYSFVYDSIKFVMHNTNGREYPLKEIPNLQWLEEQLGGDPKDGAKYYVGISHVPPTDDDFKQDLVVPYAHMLSTTHGFLLSLHAHVHDHTDGYPFNDGIRYITSFSFEQRSYLLLKIINGIVVKEIVNY